MRLIFRPGSIGKLDVTHDEDLRQEYDGFAVHPSLTVSECSSRSADGGHSSSHGISYCSPLLRIDSDTKDSAGYQVSLSAPVVKTGNRKQKLLVLLCTSLLVISVVAMVMEARQPRDCLHWSQKPNSLQVMSDNLDIALVGQELARDIILSEISQFLQKSDNRAKPLVLVFYGPSGVGKTRASEIIGQSLMSATSRLAGFGKRYSIADHQKDVPADHNVSLKISKDSCICSKSNVFLLEDLDIETKSAWLPELAPMLSGAKHDYGWHSSCQPMDNAIIILTMQVGADMLTAKVTDLYQSGLSRAGAASSVRSVARELFANASSGHIVTSIVGAVDAFIPFLPLEKQHVEMCIMDELAATNLPVTDALVSKVLSLLEFVGSQQQIVKHGCKKVAAYVHEAVSFD